MTAIALTIAGSDSGGGAGIQADLKTFSALGVFGTSVITAITAQNTLGVYGVEDVSSEMVGAQIDAVVSDIGPAATKVGVVSRTETIAVIADRLTRYRINPVLDPVMVATSGDPLLQPDAIAALREILMPLASLVTPNLHEAALLSDTALAKTEREMVRQAEAILARGACAVLLKGGHGTSRECVDIFCDGAAVVRHVSPRIETRNTHGTGCTLSAAIAAYLTLGLGLSDAVAAAKDYLSSALVASSELKIGGGNGPVHHFHSWWDKR